MTTTRDWADEVAEEYGANDTPAMRAGFAEFLRGNSYAGDFYRAHFHAAYLAGHAAGKREATTWRDPVADPPEVPPGYTYTLALVMHHPHSPGLAHYQRAIGCGPGHWVGESLLGSTNVLAWLPIPPLPEVTP